MSRNHLLYILAVLVCLIAVLHLLALSFYLYWTFWWYDIILHFLGGVFAGLLVLWLRFLSGYLDIRTMPSRTRMFCFVVITVLAIGIGWEMFERALGHTWSIEGYWFDTSLDVVLDFLGGLVAFGFFTTRYFPDGQA